MHSEYRAYEIVLIAGPNFTPHRIKVHPITRSDGTFSIQANYVDDSES